LKKEYTGFEIGPIRPPSESKSLLLRVSRNCSWNRCTFCGLFKGEKFTIRPKEYIFKDIDLIKQNIDFLKKIFVLSENEKKDKISNYFRTLSKGEQWAFYSADTWFQDDMQSVFLQDGNSLVIKPRDLIDILQYFNKAFPHNKRITSYGRSATIANISDENIQKISDSGLNRIHIGMESANDTILEILKKGATKALHIKAGKKVKKAGIELSEYYMPGAGGAEYSKNNALDSADAINQINPDFVRVRTLAIKESQELYNDFENGTLQRINDIDIVKEILLFVKKLKNIDSVIKSDHILNLLPEAEGSIKHDKEKIIKVLQDFLSLSKFEQMIYRVGRRVGYMKCIKDLKDSLKREATLYVIESENINENNIDLFIEERLNQFI
jgi:radical SAM superfamily enzyme YgiQ (UPF0313 family)